MKTEFTAHEHIARPEFPVYMWGKEHWSVLGYVESVCVNYKGKPDLRRVYANRTRHPGLFVNRGAPDTEYPVRLKNGIEVHNRDEWDCIYDMEAIGMIELLGTGIHPVFKMLPLGEIVVAELRKHKAAGGTWANFSPDFDALFALAKEAENKAA